MATVISDGPLGVEARHQWNLGFMLNLKDGTFPRVVLEEIRNYYSLPDHDDNREPLTGRKGELLLPSESRGKTITYLGHVEATTLQSLRNFNRQFRSAFANRNDEGTMRVSPDPAYGAVVWDFKARPLVLEIDDEPPPRLNRLPVPEVREFLLSMRMTDGQFYIPDDSNVGPFGHQWTQGVTNEGGAPTDLVTIRVTGMVGGDTLILRNESIPVGSATATLNIPIPTDGDIEVSFKNRTIKHTASVGGAVTYIPRNIPLSTWWDAGRPGLLSGLNNLYASGRAAMEWFVDFHHTSW